jgi:hypothetical protein
LFIRFFFLAVIKTFLLFGFRYQQKILNTGASANPQGYNSSMFRGVLSFFLFSSFFLLFFSFSALAQTPAPSIPENFQSLSVEEQKKIMEEVELGALSFGVPSSPPGTTDCFLYYKFGSVQASMDADVKKAVSGSPVTFSGLLENQNPYPIENGSLYVKIYRKEKNEDKARSNAHDQVDAFFVAENISLPAKGKKPLSFVWKVPAWAQSGEYRLATFFVVDKKFNLLGLSFTDDILGNTFDFEVKGETKGGVYFEKDKVMVNEKPFLFAAFIPKLEKEGSVTVKASVINTTNKEITAPITWKECRWDALRPENCLSEKKESVTLKPGERKTVSYTQEKTQNPVTYLLAETAYNDAKSIIGVRFARNEIDGIRLNFPGLTSFPLQKGASTTVFSCLHSFGTALVVPNGKLVLSLADQNGKEIFNHVYEGDVTGQMMGVASPFIPKKDYGKVSLKASLYKDGQLVDESVVEYGEDVVVEESFDKITAGFLFFLIFLVMAMIIFGGYRFANRS